MLCKGEEPFYGSMTSSLKEADENVSRSRACSISLRYTEHGSTWRSVAFAVSRSSIRETKLSALIAPSLRSVPIGSNLLAAREQRETDWGEDRCWRKPSSRVPADRFSSASGDEKRPAPAPSRQRQDAARGLPQSGDGLEHKRVAALRFFYQISTSLPAAHNRPISLRPQDCPLACGAILLGARSAQVL
jgi:hypothetical protein